MLVWCGEGAWWGRPFAAVDGRWSPACAGVWGAGDIGGSGCGRRCED